ncbi:hypothetical protein BcDW1_4548 [Botrytis cinerea BcDW1]|uniref:Uncharacterized protein n=1 Tax=Botryotinia fuckeliana (strain BcDW1) TaxID=1290391 RepID=M7U053_BOTF1|nr:hypothetical protein BcDW1_4548 [Botrytis cinerea BcDW1]
MEKYLMIFDPKGSKEASIDDAGNPVYQIWKIHDKWNREDGLSSLYEVQFWEEIKGKNDIYHIDEYEMKYKYGAMVDRWEKWFGTNWREEYGKFGHICGAERQRLLVSTPKRRFDDTPSKSRSIEKKSRSGKSSISSGNDLNVSNSSLTGGTHPRSGTRFDSMPLSFSPASRIGNSPISDGNDSSVSSPPLANVSRPVQGKTYTLLPPPLLAASSKSSRRSHESQQSNVGFSSGFHIPSRSARQIASGSPYPVEQSGRRSGSETGHPESPSTSRQSATRIAASYTSSHGQSAMSSISYPSHLASFSVTDQSAERLEATFSPAESRPPISETQLSTSFYPMGNDTEDQSAEEQVVGFEYDLDGSEYDDEYKEILNKFDRVTFQATIDSIHKKSGEELEAMTEQAIAKLRQEENSPMADANDGEHVENPGMILDAYSNRLVEAHSIGLKELVDAALDLKGLPCDKWVNKRREDGNLDVMKLELLFMSSCIHPDVLKHLVRGDLPKAYSDPSITSMRVHMISMMEGNKREKRIFIYIHYLVNAIGVSPSPSQLENVLKTADIYIRGFGKPNDQASYRISKKIDEMIGNHKAEPDGKRRYIKGDTQYKVINEWISLVRGRIEFDKLNNRWNEPLTRPISEVGFASSLQRLDQHRKHVSSNYIMNLIEAIFALEGGVYRNRQYIVFNCIEPCHGTFGEILCSRYAQAYSTHGGGFSHFVAGVSVANSYKHEEQNWSLAKEDLLKTNWFKPIIKEETMKLREEISMISRLYTSAQDQDEELEEMIETMESLDCLKEELSVSDERLEEMADEYTNLMDPMLEFLALVESGDLDDWVV